MYLAYRTWEKEGVSSSSSFFAVRQMIKLIVGCSGVEERENVKLVKTPRKVIISVSQDVTCYIERKINYTYSQGVFYIAYEENAPKGS